MSLRNPSFELVVTNYVSSCLVRYCSYHQRVIETQHSTDQEQNFLATRGQVTSATEIDLSSTLDRIGDFQAAVSTASSLQTINLSDTVAKPGGPTFDGTNRLSPRERDHTDPTRESELSQRANSPQLWEKAQHREDMERTAAFPHKVLGFNPEKFDHPGGDFPKVAAFTNVVDRLPVDVVQGELHRTSSGSKPIETRESHLSSTLTSSLKEQSAVEMIDLSFSSQFLGLPHAFQQQSSADVAESKPDSKYLFGTHTQHGETGKSPFILSTQYEAPKSPFEGRSTRFEPEKSAMQFLSPPQRSQSASPVFREDRSNKSPSPSNLTVDLSRFNLPSNVRRALAARYGAKKQSEIERAVALNFNDSQNRFMEEARPRLSPEYISKPQDSSSLRKAIFAPGRLRLQRSTSLDSRPTKPEALQKESDAPLQNKDVRKPSPLLSKNWTQYSEGRSSVPIGTAPSYQPSVPSSRMTSSIGSFGLDATSSGRPSVLHMSSVTGESVHPFQKQGMIDLSSAAYLQTMEEFPSKRRDGPESSLSESLQKVGTLDVKDSQASEQGKSFQSEPENTSMFELTVTRKRLGSFDETLRNMGEVSGKSPVKKLRSHDTSKQDDAVVSYAPGVNVQELLNIERGEQKQMVALSRVQSQLKDVRAKIQKLCTVLDSLHAEENLVTSRMGQLRSARLKVLQSALYEQRSASSKGTDSSRGDSTMAPSVQGSVRQTFRSGPRDDAMDSANISGEVGSQKPVTEGSTLERDTPSTRVGPSKDNLLEAQETEVLRPQGETDSTYENQELDLRDAADSVNDARGMYLADVPHETENHVRPLRCEDQSSSKGGSIQVEKRSQRAKFGRVLNQTRASVTRPFSRSEGSGAVMHENEGGSSLPEENVFALRSNAVSRDSYEPSQGGESEASRLTKRHRKRVVWNVKRQGRGSPRKHYFSEDRVSNTLAVSKQKLQSVRENMTRWKRQSEGLGESPVPSEEGLARDGVSTPTMRHSREEYSEKSVTPFVQDKKSPWKTTKELKKSSLFKMGKKGPSDGKKRSKDGRPRRSRHHSRGGHGHDDPAKKARLEEALTNTTQVGALRMAQKRINQKGTSSCSTAMPQKRASSSDTAVSQKGATSSSTTVSRKRTSSSGTIESQKKSSSTSTTVPQKGASPSATTVSQKGTSLSGMTMTTQEGKNYVKERDRRDGTNACTTGATELVKCKQEDCGFMNDDEIPTRDVVCTVEFRK